ncbi:MAG: flavodoxin family protein [Bacteroidetes bacterium HGW-Bacteroidetes-17]|jgi:multimeric flavodoxin WrbA|nr:MAG: flavodoxin family protein [Bacteroidetes bacterium HGW-Bacteroidetes-17]
MKVIAINGSPNKEGNTFHALNMVGDELISAGIDFEILHIGHKMIHGCTACGKCAVNKDEKCSLKTDDLNVWIQQIKEADGIILGSPVYYSGIAGTMKSFLDRLFYVSGANGNLFRHKVGAAVVAVRRSGGSATLDGLYHYIAYAEMIIATSNYWNIIHGRNAGEVEQDIEGKQIMRVLGKNMAWLLKMKEATKNTIEAPKKEKKEVTNFIR